MTRASAIAENRYRALSSDSHQGKSWAGWLPKALHETSRLTLMPITDSPTPIMVPLVIGVTSHRNISAREIEPIRQCLQDFFARLKREFPGLPLVLLSALAEGGDQLVAQEALAAGARLLAPLPLPRELYADDFADPASRASFDTLCAQAEVMQLPVRAGQSLHDVRSPGTARDHQYAQVGVYIASHCHILLAIWDGKPSTRVGGTAQIVKYHLSGTTPGQSDRRRSTRHELGAGDERLLYHIACSRDAADGAPADGLLPLQTLWRSADTAVATDPGKPAEFHRMFAHMAEFNADCAKYAAAIDAATPAPRDVSADASMNVDHLFHAADWLAIHFQKRVLLALRSTYTLAALMGIAFTCYAHLPEQNYLIYCSCCCSGLVPSWPCSPGAVNGIASIWTTARWRKACAYSSTGGAQASR